MYTPTTVSDLRIKLPCPACGRAGKFASRAWRGAGRMHIHLQNRTCNACRWRAPIADHEVELDELGPQLHELLALPLACTEPGEE